MNGITTVCHYYCQDEWKTSGNLKLRECSPQSEEPSCFRGWMFYQKIYKEIYIKLNIKESFFLGCK